MSLNLEAKGLAGLFGLQYEQRSVGTVDAKGMRPERFSVDQRGRKLESAGRLLTTAAMWTPGMRARTMASMLLPRPEMRMTMDFMNKPLD